MIIVRLLGGIGNQMFQYALGRHLALINQTELKLDKSFLEADPQREYRLNHFLIEDSFATTNEIANTRLIYEPDLRFYPSILTETDGVYLAGYWQSELYFGAIKNILKREFTFKDPLDTRNIELVASMKKENSVCIHVRRGDYVDNKTTSDFLGVCSLEYYKRALEKLLSTVSMKLTFYIFSDDPEWVCHQSVFQELKPTIVQDNLQSEWIDLELMSNCKYFIIANSSFSWWGAWLANYSSKLVYAPQQWFRNLEAKDNDIIPSSWRTI